VAPTDLVVTVSAGDDHSALVEQALEDCRTWYALPDPNGTAHILALEVERQRAELARLREMVRMTL
jgi:hypothetical protein